MGYLGFLKYYNFYKKAPLQARGLPNDGRRAVLLRRVPRMGECESVFRSRRRLADFDGGAVGSWSRSEESPSVNFALLGRINNMLIYCSTQVVAKVKDNVSVTVGGSEIYPSQHVMMSALRIPNNDDRVSFFWDFRWENLVSHSVKLLFLVWLWRANKIQYQIII